jgi:hypothetical protein
LIFATCIAVLAKYAATGYEYLTTALLMMLVPLVYYGIARAWSRERALEIVSAVVAGTALATLLSIAIQSLQIRIVTGTFRDAFDHFVVALLMRSSGDGRWFSPVIAESLRTPVISVLTTYLAGYYFEPIKYWHVFALFILAILVLLARRRNRPDWAYITTLCFSVLAPLTWLVIFKGHSQIHTHMDFIVWQMPFTLLGFGVIGRAAASVVDSLRPKTLNKNLNGDGESLLHDTPAVLNRRTRKP